jgi:hypothetical protein
LNSELFAKDILKLAQKARHVLEREPRVVYLSSPTYIIGDIVSIFISLSSWRART